MANIKKLKSEFRPIYSLKRYKDRLLKPVNTQLDKLGIKADYITYFSFILVVPIFFLVESYSFWVIAILGLNLILDLLDGSLARFHKRKDLEYGRFNDLVFDHLFVWLFTMILFIYGEIAGFWYVFYLFNYVICFFVRLFLNSLGEQSRFIFGTLYFVYLIYFIDVLFGVDLFNIYFVFSSLFTMVLNVFYLNSLRWKLSQQ